MQHQAFPLHKTWLLLRTSKDLSWGHYCPGLQRRPCVAFCCCLTAHSEGSVERGLWEQKNGLWYWTQRITDKFGSQRKDCSFPPVGFCMHSKIYFSSSPKLFFDFCIWTLSRSIYCTCFENVTVLRRILTNISPSQWPFLLYT